MFRKSYPHITVLSLFQIRVFLLIYIVFTAIFYCTVNILCCSFPKYRFFLTKTLFCFPHKYRLNTYQFLHCIFSVFFVSNIWFSLPIIPYIPNSSLYIFCIFCFNFMVFLTNNPVVPAIFYCFLLDTKFHNCCHCCVLHHVQIVLFLWQCLVQFARSSTGTCCGFAAISLTSAFGIFSSNGQIPTMCL